MNPEQQRRLEKAARSLQAARGLNDSGFAEFAASRAYYAMFYVAEAFLEGEGLSFSRHSAVIASFGQQFARTDRLPVEYHRYLIEAERIRRSADYSTTAKITKQSANQLIIQAEEFLEFARTNIDSLPPP